MNFEPPDFTKDVALPPRSFSQQIRTNPNFQSPLLKHKPNPNFNRSVPSASQNYQQKYNQNRNVQARLGHKAPYQNGAEDNQSDGRNNYRKRLSDGDNPNYAKRRNNRNNPYFKLPYSSKTNLAQDRLSSLRSSLSSLNQPDNYQEQPNFNDSQEEPTDITIEVVNNNVQPTPRENSCAPFKLILDQKIQSAIKIIQSKAKNKQVIIPSPVTPFTTSISINERFSML